MFYSIKYIGSDIVRYRRVRQENIKDCAVACLLSIIRYYGGNNTMENLRYLTKCDKNGVNALNLIEASKKLGFDSYGIKCNFKYLLDNIKPPFIAHVILNNSYKHYVVIERIDKKHKKIIVNDSALGLKKYSYNDFKCIWTNVVIILHPIRKLDNIKSLNILRFYINIIKKYKIKFIIIMLFTIISIILTIINTYYFKILIDSFNSLNKVYIVFLFIIVFKCIFDLLRNKIIININKTVDDTITKDIYNKLLSLPNYYFNSRQTGDIMNRINELEYIKELIVKIPIIIFTNLLLVILSSIILFNINMRLFIIFLIVVLVYGLIEFLFNGRNKRYIRETQENSSIINSHIKESICGISTIKNLNIEGYISDKFNEKYNTLLNNKYNYEKSYNIESILKYLVMFIGINTILYIGFIYVNNEAMLLSNLILFNLIIVYFLDPLKEIFDLVPSIRTGINSIKRIDEIHNIKQNNGNYITNNIYKININNLTFSYNNLDNIFENISIDIKKGDRIVITGNSGSGKSTLFKIITKQYEIDNSNIFINDIDINYWDIKSIRDNICYVSQDEKLFTDSLINNITLGINIDSKTIKKMCKLTYVDEIMRNKNISLDSLIEEEGINFSAGERQRIILLRCLIRNNNVLILDESLNGVDLYLERKILRNIIRLYKDKILIYITHRTDNISLFNKIIDFNKKGVKK